MKNNKNLYKTVFLSPFKYLKPSVRTEAYFILTLMIPQLIMLAVTKSYNSLLIIAVTTISSNLVELIDKNFQKKDKFSWEISSIRGILIGLLLPSGFPLIPVFFITFVALALNKFILGGFANSWVNPIAITIAVCWIVGMKFFPQVSVTLNELQTKNPALTLIQNGTFPINSFDVRITTFLNQKVFSLFKVSIPDGYVSLLWDSHSSIPAFRFNLITLLSSILIIGFDIIHPLIPGIFILTYSLLVKFAAPFFYNGQFMQGDIILALMTSGTLFCTFFILQWHGTIPLTNRGKTAYAVIAGIIAFLIVGCGTSPSGAVFTVLFMNIISLLIQSVENYFSERFSLTVLKEKVKQIKEGINA